MSGPTRCIRCGRLREPDEAPRSWVALSDGQSLTDYQCPACTTPLEHLTASVNVVFADARAAAAARRADPATTRIREVIDEVWEDWFIRAAEGHAPIGHDGDDFDPFELADRVLERIAGIPRPAVEAHREREQLAATFRDILADALDEQ